MIAALLLATAAQERTLITAFASTCLAQGAPTSGVTAAAAAAGFEPVPLRPAAGEPRETAAWSRNGVRLALFSAQTDQRWPLPSSCEAEADVGRLADDHSLLATLGKYGAAGFVEGQVGRRASHWTIPWQDGRLVQVFTDHTHRQHVHVTLLAYPARQ